LDSLWVFSEALLTMDVIIQPCGNFLGCVGATLTFNRVLAGSSTLPRCVVNLGAGVDIQPSFPSLALLPTNYGSCISRRGCYHLYTLERSVLTIFNFSGSGECVVRKPIKFGNIAVEVFRDEGGEIPQIREIDGRVGSILVIQFLVVNDFPI
jgi:hypothetical protein